MAKDGSATIREWERKKAKREQNHDAAKAGMFKVFQEALKHDAVREAVKDDLKAAKSNRSSFSPGTADYNLVKDDYDETVDGLKSFVDDF